MGRTMAIGSALGRSLEMFKNSRAVSQFISPQGIPTVPLSAAVAPTRGYVSATDSAHVLDSFTRNSNLRANLSRGLPLHSHKTTARLFSSVTGKVEDLVESNKVVVFSKSYCPFCDATKKLFKTMNVEFLVLELDQMGNEGTEIQRALFELTNQRSVPNVFVGGKHVGGNDDTQAAARNGSLQEMLK